jgi:hypothetical protein
MRAPRSAQLPVQLTAACRVACCLPLLLQVETDVLAASELDTTQYLQLKERLVCASQAGEPRRASCCPDCCPRCPPPRCWAILAYQSPIAGIDIPPCAAGAQICPRPSTPFSTLEIDLRPFQRHFPRLSMARRSAARFAAAAACIAGGRRPEATTGTRRPAQHQALPATNHASLLPCCSIGNGVTFLNRVLSSRLFAAQAAPSSVPLQGATAAAAERSGWQGCLVVQCPSSIAQPCC